MSGGQRTVFDTGPVVAALDRADRYHRACTELIANTPGVLLLPVPVIVEAAQLAHARLGVAAEAAFTESVAREQQFTIISPTEETLARGGADAPVRRPAPRPGRCVRDRAGRAAGRHPDRHPGPAALHRRAPQHVVAFTLLPA